MFGLSLGFLGVSSLWAGIGGEQAIRIIGGDRWMSLVILLAVSFVFGFSIACFRRDRKPRSTVSTQTR